MLIRVAMLCFVCRLEQMHHAIHSVSFEDFLSSFIVKKPDRNSEELTLCNISATITMTLKTRRFLK